MQGASGGAAGAKEGHRSGCPRGSLHRRHPERRATAEVDMSQDYPGEATLAGQLKTK